MQKQRRGGCVGRTITATTLFWQAVKLRLPTIAVTHGQALRRGEEVPAPVAEQMQRRDVGAVLLAGLGDLVHATHPNGEMPGKPRQMDFYKQCSLRKSSCWNRCFGCYIGTDATLAGEELRHQDTLF